MSWSKTGYYFSHCMQMDPLHYGDNKDLSKMALARHTKFVPKKTFTKQQAFLKDAYEQLNALYQSEIFFSNKQPCIAGWGLAILLSQSKKIQNNVVAKEAVDVFIAHLKTTTSILLRQNTYSYKIPQSDLETLQKNYAALINNPIVSKVLMYDRAQRRLAVGAIATTAILLSLAATGAVIYGNTLFVHIPSGAVSMVVAMHLFGPMLAATLTACTILALSALLLYASYQTIRSIQLNPEEKAIEKDYQFTPTPQKQL